MEDWEHEIAARNLERILSISFQLSKAAQDDLEKGIADDIGYQQEFQIEKTGKEIKEKLQAELRAVTSAKEALLAKMEQLVEKIGQPPMGKTDSWETRGWEKLLGIIPLKYCYTQIYPEKRQEEGIYPVDSLGCTGGITPIHSKDVADNMRIYNEASSDYIRRSIEALKLQTILNNIPDEKKIKLTIQLATQLGF